MTYEVGGTRRPTLTIDLYDADTVVVLTITSPLGVVSTPAITGVAGTWTADVPYTLTAPQRWYERWISTNAVSGLGAGSKTVAIDVEPTPPAAGPGQTAAYATVAQYAAIIGGPLPTNLARLLRVASATVRRNIGGAPIYDAASAAILAALAEATCEQVKYAAENGWTNGRPMPTRAVSIGSAALGATINPGAGGNAPMPELSPISYDLLLEAGLIGGEPSQFFTTWGVTV